MPVSQGKLGSVGPDCEPSDISESLSGVDPIFLTDNCFPCMVLPCLELGPALHGSAQVRPQRPSFYPKYLCKIRQQYDILKGTSILVLTGAHTVDHCHMMGSMLCRTL